MNDTDIQLLAEQASAAEAKASSDSDVVRRRLDLLVRASELIPSPKSRLLFWIRCPMCNSRVHRSETLVWQSISGDSLFIYYYRCASATCQYEYAKKHLSIGG